MSCRASRAVMGSARRCVARCGADSTCMLFQLLHVDFTVSQLKQQAVTISHEAASTCMLFQLLQQVHFTVSQLKQ